jgi:(5-formylfuran-3-yl)methyl phosphate synthase
MIRLLVSVRSVAEASLAVHNGADMIDIKEPSRGSLGMCSPEKIGTIAREVPPRFPVSAALGEWESWTRARALPFLPEGLSYVKMGLEGAGRREGWREELGQFCRQVSAIASISGPPAWVAVAYADWERAGAPRPAEVLDFAAAGGFEAFLIDTWRKDSTCVFDWLDPEATGALLDRARARGLETALAGALTGSTLRQAIALAPDILAVRGAVCRDGRREAGLDPDALRELAGALADMPDAVGATV